MLSKKTIIKKRGIYTRPKNLFVYLFDDPGDLGARSMEVEVDNNHREKGRQRDQNHVQTVVGTCKHIH